MINFPETIRCKKHDLFIQKVCKDDIKYIWENSPLNQLFQVTGSEATSVSELEEIMQLDWTTWYLMLDKNGFSYGLIHLVPELDNSVSMHGIGWTQLNKSPRIFILSWYAMHYYIFEKGATYIGSYCEATNYNAIKFDLKTGYYYDYCMPSRQKKSKIIHLKIEKFNFIQLLFIKKIHFELKESFDFSSKNQVLIQGKASSSAAKETKFIISLLKQEEEINEFYNTNHSDNFFYFFYLIPRPKLYSFSLKGKLLGYFLFLIVAKTKKLILFNLNSIDFADYLEFTNFLKNKFDLILGDIVILEDKTDSTYFKDALSVNFKYAGNHSCTDKSIWIV